MAKRSKSSDTFGEAGGEEMISPLSFQLNGDGTPKDPCGMLPSEAGKESYEPPDPKKLGNINVTGGG